MDTGCLQQGLQLYPVFQTLRHKSLMNKILALVLHAVKDIIDQALGNEYRYSICMHCFRSLLVPRRKYSSWNIGLLLILAWHFLMRSLKLTILNKYFGNAYERFWRLAMSTYHYLLFVCKWTEYRIRLWLIPKATNSNSIIRFRFIWQTGLIGTHRATNYSAQ